MNTQAQKDLQSCKRCRHFFVTYDQHFPYGCRSMGFKSRRYPYLEVQEATGEPCQGREMRPMDGDGRVGPSGSAGRGVP